MVKKIPRQIKLDQLKVGMYVVKLDISWMDSPFLSHARKIKSEKDISLLKKSGVKILIIDPDKGIDITHQEPQTPVIHEDNPSTPISEKTNELSVQTSPGNIPEPKEKFLEKEINLALEIRSRVKRAIVNLHKDLNSGGAFNSNDVSPLIESTLSSIERYHHALLNLAHISKRNLKVADHTFSTFCIALSLAKKFGLPEKDIESLGIAALIHEVGWTQIPISLMGKRIRYTEPEIKLIEQHSRTAMKTIEKCEIPDVSKRIVAEHHELCDGSGYPNQLTAQQIHPLSKIFSVADRYDELVNQLNDQPGMLPTAALRHLYLHGKKQIYDEQCVSHLISLLGVYPVSSAVGLSNGALGIVREVPNDNNLKPLVEVRVSEQNQPLQRPYYLDLACDKSTEESVTITKVIDPNDSKEPHYRLLILDL